MGSAILKQLKIEDLLRTRWQGANKKMKEMGQELDVGEESSDL